MPSKPPNYFSLNYDQKQLVARSLANLDELKPIMEHAKNGDALQIIAESKHLISSLDMAIKCLEELYKLETAHEKKLD